MFLFNIFLLWCKNRNILSKNKTFEFEVTKEYLTEIYIPRSGALREEKFGPDFRVMSMCVVVKITTVFEIAHGDGKGL